MTIRIGIATCLDARERWRVGRDYLYIDRLYTQAVEAAGAIPILLPVQEDAVALIAGVDGLVIPGGDDFLPSAPYPAEVSFDPTPEAQIDFDGRLVAAALDAGLPTLGICYGAQLLALGRGGRLHHDIAHDFPEASPHLLPEAEDRHACLAEPDSLLATLFDGDSADVNSLHHQAIADPGEGLVVSGRAPDGVVEAIESGTAPFVLGVQWHPERLDGRAGAGLFDALVSAARKNAGEPSEADDRG